MRRAAPLLRTLTAIALLATTAAGGFLAMCPRPGAVVHAHMMAAHEHMAAAHSHMAAAHAHVAAAHRVMYAAVHRHAPERPPPPPQPDDWKECPSMGMSGASCFGASHAATLELAPDQRMGGDRYPPASDVHDRLPSDLLSDPPRA